MINRYRRFAVCLLWLATISMAGVARASAQDNADSIVITFKDGHQSTFALSDIRQIEFKSSPGAKSSSQTDLPGRHHFVGKWSVGDSQGHTYIFTLRDNGEATNNVESGGHGTWAYANGEVHVSWDNGWHDVIRKVGSKYRKFAYEPGKPLDGPASNEGDAQKTNPEPI